MIHIRDIELKEVENQDCMVFTVDTPKDPGLQVCIPLWLVGFIIKEIEL